MIRIALCDDEAALMQSYAGMIREWSDRTGCPCEISTFNSSRNLLLEFRDGYFFDLLLLDIEMPEMNGMELAREIRQTDRKVIIVFLTNYDNFVFEGYEVGAYRYLMKSKAAEKLGGLLDDVAEREQEMEYLLVRAGGCDERLELSGILYLEASRHDTLLHTRDGERLLKMPIHKLAELLPENFLFCHRSFMVNLQYLERLSKTECLMYSGETVPVSRAAYGPLNEAFIGYYKKREGIEG